MNTPNKLTVARMILVPFLVLFMLTHLGGEANRYIELAIFVAQELFAPSHNIPDNVAKVVSIAASILSRGNPSKNANAPATPPPEQTTPQ